MIVLRDPNSVNGIPDPDIRSLVSQRFAEVWPHENYDPNVDGYMIVVEPGDVVQAIEAESKCRILQSQFGQARYGDPAYETSFEFLDEHACCYEMAFILSDDGYGIEIFIPKNDGIDAALLAMCAEYATPALTTAISE